MPIKIKAKFVPGQLSAVKGQVSRSVCASRGQLTIQILILGFVTTIVLAGFVVWSDTYVRNVSRERNKSQAFTIAEAGIEYYRWHLAHSPTDFTDGSTSSQPYIHPYYDKDNVRIGEFRLVITAPATGTTIVTVQSTGAVDADPTAEKIIKVKMGLPSLARFSVVSASDVRFGAGTSVYGELHSNGGIRFDGVAYNKVTSAKYKYDDPDHSGGNEFGVHTHVSPTDPLPGSATQEPPSPPVRTDVFTAGRQLSVPAVDFTGITQDLSNIKALASSSGKYYGPSGGTNKGYLIVFKTNDTFDIYKVKTVKAPPQNCTNYLNQAGWGTWSVNTTSTVATGVAFPSNGLIFVEDDLWVQGQINTARLTIAAARFPVNPTTYADIIVNNDLLYTNYDGSDVLSIIAQEHVTVGLKSEDDLRIDGAQVAQNGRVGRYYYRSYCGSEYKRNSITAYGMLGSNQRYGWAYTDGTGYQTRTLTYDGYLLYGPPPSFPITASQYDIISWEETK